MTLLVKIYSMTDTQETLNKCFFAAYRCFIDQRSLKLFQNLGMKNKTLFADNAIDTGGVKYPGSNPRHSFKCRVESRHVHGNANDFNLVTAANSQR